MGAIACLKGSGPSEDQTQKRHAEIVMFTGLVQALGELTVLEGSVRIHCVAGDTQSILQDLAIGDSIAVDGICLTATQCLGNGFLADVSPETLQRSTLGDLPTGSLVNLESSLRAGGKVGGHFVTGHVDGVGWLISAEATEQSWLLKFGVPAGSLQRYLVEKGSIAVNGISLTIADCDREGHWFTVAVIPHTYQETTLRRLQAGVRVNLEGDILGKYVERLLRHSGHSTPQSDISLEFLTEHGYV